MLTDVKKTLDLFLAKRVAYNTPIEGLKGKVVIITGAGRGIGKATAEVLHKEGVNLVLISRNSDLEKVFPGFSEESTLLLNADVSKSEDVVRIVDESIKKFGEIDVLVNNAGIFLDKPIDEVTLSEIDSIISTNVKGVVLMCREVTPYMKKRNQGFILNIGSKISHNTNVSPNKVLYAMTKYAVEGLSTALRNELKPFGIRVSCLMPGTVNTFVSLKSGSYLSPYRVGEIIAMMIKFSDVDFENMVIKSKDQQI